SNSDRVRRSPKVVIYLELSTLPPTHTGRWDKMTKKLVSKTLLALAAGCAMTAPAMAGGLERGGYNIDLLFDEGRFAAESAVTYVAPQRKVKNVRDINATADPDIGGLDLNALPDH